MKHTKADKKRSDSERNLKPVKKQKTGKPKKPPTAYFVFLEEFREKYKRDNPNVKGVTAVVKACGAKWRSMTEQEKAPYVAKAAQKKAQYDDSVADFIRNRKLGMGLVKRLTLERSKVGMRKKTNAIAVVSGADC